MYMCTFLYCIIFTEFSEVMKKKMLILNQKGKIMWMWIDTDP